MKRFGRCGCKKHHTNNTYINTFSRFTVPFSNISPSLHNYTYVTALYTLISHECMVRLICSVCTLLYGKEVGSLGPLQLGAQHLCSTASDKLTMIEVEHKLSKSIAYMQHLKCYNCIHRANVKKKNKFFHEMCS